MQVVSGVSGVSGVDGDVDVDVDELEFARTGPSDSGPLRSYVRAPGGTTWTAAYLRSATFSSIDTALAYMLWLMVVEGAEVGALQPP